LRTHTAADVKAPNSRLEMRMMFTRPARPA
jgi:hypothetical protein